MAENFRKTSQENKRQSEVSRQSKVAY